MEHPERCLRLFLADHASQRQGSRRPVQQKPTRRRRWRASARHRRAAPVEVYLARPLARPDLDPWLKAKLNAELYPLLKPMLKALLKAALNTTLQPEAGTSAGRLCADAATSADLRPA